jgi:two-component system response regulator
MEGNVKGSGKGKTILLVEDDHDDEALTLRALRKSDIHNPVKVVRDGAEALEFLFARDIHSGRDLTDLPVVVLLDLKLPKVDGLEVLRRLRMDERTQRLPVVVLSSSSEAQDIAKSYALGANSFVHKPVDFDQFARSIGILGMYWVGVNEVIG